MCKQIIALLRARYSPRNILHLSAPLSLLLGIQPTHDLNAQAMRFSTFVEQSSPQLSQQTAAAQNSEVTALSPGHPIDREISDGQTQTYQIALITGQFASASVQQRGIDVLLR